MPYRLPHALPHRPAAPLLTVRRHIDLVRVAATGCR
ncbi:putative leader peptide [Peterkaempfera bronchialis]|nr:putative leader peptide [Peterkaempfera bronchialis]